MSAAHLTNEIERLEKEVERLKRQNAAMKEAIRDAYLAGRWECPTMPADKQRRLWESLRNAAGIMPGTATELGVAADSAGSDLLTREQVKPLVEALQNYAVDTWDGECAKTALIHAKTLGFDA